MYITLDIEVETKIDGEVDYIDVEIEGQPKWENHSFYYEYGSINETNKMSSYLAMEDSEITWDESLHSPKQNVFIKKHIDKHREDLENKIIAKAKIKYDER